MTGIEIDAEVTLSAPEGVEAIEVEIRFDPPTSGCIIYGYDAGGDLLPIQIVGSGRYNLPYCHPKIFVRYLPSLLTIEISVAGFSLPSGFPAGPGAGLH